MGTHGDSLHTITVGFAPTPLPSPLRPPRAALGRMWATHAKTADFGCIDAFQGGKATQHTHNFGETPAQKHPPCCTLQK